MTLREENEVLAQWAGIECRCQYWDDAKTKRVWEETCPRHSNNGNPPDYDRDEVAISLVPILVDKGYWYDMKNLAPNWAEFLIYWDVTANPVASGTKQTIAAAIKAAVLQLKEK